MDLLPFLPILLAVHIALAVTLFLPSILLPLLLRRRPDAHASGSGPRTTRRGGDGPIASATCPTRWLRSWGRSGS